MVEDKLADTRKQVTELGRVGWDILVDIGNMSVQAGDAA